MIDFAQVARIVPVLHAGAIAAAPRELCGLLLLDAAAGWQAAVVRNVAARASGFEFDGLDFARVERAARGRGEHLAGYFHTHGDGSVTASAADRVGVLWGECMPCWRLIVGITGDWALYDARAAGWRVVVRGRGAECGPVSADVGHSRDRTGGAGARWPAARD
ncbi:MAG: Mov34/MPN/PAD-1 family protein [Phycisphaerae bacterium]